MKKTLQTVWPKLKLSIVIGTSAGLFLALILSLRIVSESHADDHRAPHEVFLELGHVHRGDRVLRTIEVKNASDRPVLMRVVKGTRGCLLFGDITRKRNVDAGDTCHFAFTVEIPRDWNGTQYDGYFLIRTNTKTDLKVIVTGKFLEPVFVE